MAIIKDNRMTIIIISNNKIITCVILIKYKHSLMYNFSKVNL